MQVGVEDWGERFEGHQEVLACRAPATVVSEAAAGDEVMDVRMIEQLPGPGVEHADHPEAGADEARVLGQLQQSSGGSAKEQVIDRLLITAHDGAQLPGPGERYEQIAHPY